MFYYISVAVVITIMFCVAWLVFENKRIHNANDTNEIERKEFYFKLLKEVVNRTVNAYNQKKIDGKELTAEEKAQIFIDVKNDIYASLSPQVFHYLKIYFQDVDLVINNFIEDAVRYFKKEGK